MSRQESSSEIDLQALFESGKEVPRQPESVRARVLARARAAAAAPVPSTAKVPSAHLQVPRYAVTLAASGALVLGLAGAVYALSGRWSRAHEPAGSASPTSSAASVTSVRGSAEPSAAVTASSAGALPPATTSSRPESDDAARIDPARPHGRRLAEPRADYDAELRLMRGAHTAYAAHAFANALVLVSEHARRFPAGLLAEEREALRVRCLLGSGQTGEAQRAAHAFARRFPRSVLLPRIQAEVGTNAP